MNDKKQNNTVFSKVIAGLILYTFFLIAIFTANFSVLDVSDDVGKWGSVGDYFGGLLNPILAFLSFMGVLWTLKMSRKELFETRKVMNEQLKTQTLQQFENNFYQLFSQLNKLQDDVLDKCEKDIEDILATRTLNINDVKEKLIQERKISRYFILLYQILKLIDVEVLKFPSSYSTDSSEWKDEKLIQKKFYTNLIRSQQDNKMLQLLFINCFDDGFSDFKKYLKEASFFEHMSFMGDGGTSYRYLVLRALPFYILDRMLLKEAKGIPFFDKNLELLSLVKDSFILRHIYVHHNQVFDELNFLRSIIRENFPYGTKFLDDVNRKNTLNNFALDTDYSLSFKLNNDSLREEIVVDVTIFKIELGVSEVRLVGADNEKVILHLDNKKIELLMLDNGRQTIFDGHYISDSEAL
ncbi:putative phage abortive infection protein [Acinetobacter faecalis]|uniref:putative phage abortive infection protein n=1 Tax=Acinetobacter faecalis TaxID=2665161 RepID=UPI002A91C3E9|nr:putative phage abortive infection protein [Acinetobacter faecalis]MDY6461198.1 putative phage abortive infection protein [Acinetobacter faecalis]